MPNGIIPFGQDRKLIKKNDYEKRRKENGRDYSSPPTKQSDSQC